MQDRPIHIIQDNSSFEEGDTNDDPFEQFDNLFMTEPQERDPIVEDPQEVNPPRADPPLQDTYTAENRQAFTLYDIPPLK